MNNPSITAAYELVGADYGMSLPVTVSLGGDQTPIRCDRLLRLLPGRRVVLAGDWEYEGNHERVVLKLFFREKEWLREMDGYQRLCEAMLQVPACLLGWEADGGNVYALVYRFVEGESLHQLWETAETDLERTSYMAQAAEMVARMHDYGLQQTDIHLDNFLMSENGIYALDAGAVIQHASPLDQSLALKNLGLMLAQVPAYYDRGQVDETLKSYNQHNPCYQLQQDALQDAVVHMRAERWRRYQRKVTRSCTEFIARKNWQRFQVLRRDYDSEMLQTVLHDPDAAIAQGELLKNGNTATVAKIMVDGQPLVIKRYNLKNIRHRLSRCWRRTRAWHSWISGYHLRFAGVSTPLPIAMVEERFGPLRGRAFLITEYTPQQDMKSMVETISDSAKARAQLCEIAERMETLFEQFYTAGLSHGDMKATNLLVDTKGIAVIDLDAVQHHKDKKRLHKLLRKDVQRFLRNWDTDTSKTFESSLKIAQMLEEKG